ncbi:YjbH domain-containing protein [Sinimarinibacterium thermocellulolyticum]|uniref:YjbH domain-containing protein n=1 Tax=Sinimarinibacterium thermocellulolyticum TaxID=3170016 RepID=A0ABV2A5K2_9GAMM
MLRHLARVVAAAAAACTLQLGATTPNGDWMSQIGYPGALQTPTAFMAPEGSLGFGLSRTLPYNTLFLSGQPFEWLNFNARYTEITDRPYRSSRTGQTYKDKAFDLALRFYPGGGFMPALSVGIVDLGGTGLFASEYVVASQRFFDVYASLGLGWGRLGSAGDLRNPLRAVSDRFLERPRGFVGGVDRGGTIGYETWFRGEDVALFGSLIWRPSFLPDWTFMAELEGNDYSDEPAIRPVSSPSRVNVGIGYALADYASLGASYLRGDTFSFELALHPRSRVNERPPGKPYLPVLDEAVHPAYQRRLPADDEQRLEQLYDVLRYAGYPVHAMDLAPDGENFTVWVSGWGSDSPVHQLQAVGRHAANYLPQRVRSITIVTMAGGAEASRISAPRWLIEAEGRGQATVEELVVQSAFAPGEARQIDRARYPDLLRYPTYAWGVQPTVRTNIGGPTAFFLGQLLLAPYFTFQATRSLSLTTVLGVSVVNDLDRLNEPIRSGTLPPVRGDLELYQSGSGDVYLAELEANWLFPIASQWYGRVSAGIFEDMYGGVGSEVLYRPYASRWAVSVNANYVRKRGYEQRFDFLDYTVATGHLNLYYRTPLAGIVVHASAGRYLAKDVGATLDLSREFRNGARFGVFATKTNVSSAEFGEGSFDKGFYVFLPLSIASKGQKSPGLAINWRFLTRDGGAKVDDGRPLYSVYGSHHAGAVYER